MRPETRRGQLGFTLIELMLALTIVATLLAVTFAGLRVGLGAWRRGEARAEAQQHVRSLFSVLARTVGGGELGDADALALALALGEDDAVLGAMRAPPRKTRPMTRTVMRLPATAASATGYAERISSMSPMTVPSVR